jgi:hypothetical protein
MRGNSPLTLKQLSLNAAVRGGQPVAPAALPLTLDRELEAARRLLGRYRITAFEVESVMMDGVDITEQDRDRLAMYYSGNGFAVGGVLAVEGKWGAAPCSDCEDREVWTSYFEAGRLRREAIHLHGGSVPPGGVRRADSEDVIRLDSRGRLEWRSSMVMETAFRGRPGAYTVTLVVRGERAQPLNIHSFSRVHNVRVK